MWATVCAETGAIGTLILRARTQGLATMATIDESSNNPQLASLLEALGQPLIRFSPTWWSGLVGVGVGAAMITAAIAFELSFLTWFGVLAFVVGVGTIAHELLSFAYTICPGGLVMQRWGRIESCPWSQIATLEFEQTTTLVNGWSVGSAPTLTAVIARHDGRKFTLKWLTRPVAEYIEAKACQIMMPVAHEKLDAGQEVGFGQVALSLTGLRHRKIFVCWKEIESVTFQQRAGVRMRDGSVRHLQDVPNLSLCLAMAGDCLMRANVQVAS